MREIFDEFSRACPRAWAKDYIEHTKLLNSILWKPDKPPMFVEFRRWKRSFPPERGGLDNPKVIRLCNLQLAGISARIVGRTADDTLYMAKIINPYGPHKFIPYKSMKDLVGDIE